MLGGGIEPHATVIAAGGVIVGNEAVIIVAEAVAVHPLKSVTVTV